MARRESKTGSFTVGGDERTCTSLTHAASLAQTLACKATEPRQWGIYDNGTKVARVERHDNGVVTTTTFGEETKP